MVRFASSLLLLVALFASCGKDEPRPHELTVASVRDPDEKQQILGDTQVSDRWFYDDLPGALEAAAREGRPVFLVFR